MKILLLTNWISSASPVDPVDSQSKDPASIQHITEDRFRGMISDILACVCSAGWSLLISVRETSAEALEVINDEASKVSFGNKQARIFAFCRSSGDAEIFDRYIDSKITFVPVLGEDIGVAFRAVNEATAVICLSNADEHAMSYRDIADASGKVYVPLPWLGVTSKDIWRRRSIPFTVDEKSVIGANWSAGHAQTALNCIRDIVKSRDKNVSLRRRRALQFSSYTMLAEMAACLALAISVSRSPESDLTDALISISSMMLMLIAGASVGTLLRYVRAPHRITAGSWSGLGLLEETVGPLCLSFAAFFILILAKVTTSNQGVEDQAWLQSIPYPLLGAIGFAAGFLSERVEEWVSRKSSSGILE